ncbi:hypothetical protein ACS0TY_004394 [Phlomoides rotata]
MTTLTATLLPSKLKQTFLLKEQNPSFLHCTTTRRTNKNGSMLPAVARLFGPATFDPSKLKVIYLEADYDVRKFLLPRTYTLTHCDITSKLTLAVSQTINTSQLQGWYHRLHRDEVVAIWKKIKGKMSLHVHCHISGGHFLLDIFAELRYSIFCKELPVVLKAFVHGDAKLFNNYPELEEAWAWVYFHSNIPEFNKVECWGPLIKPFFLHFHTPSPCLHTCTCCSTDHLKLPPPYI